MPNGYLEFYESICRRDSACPETLRGKELYRRYSRFHAASSKFATFLSESTFGTRNKRLPGLSMTKDAKRITFQLDKPVILEHVQKHLGVLPRRKKAVPRLLKRPIKRPKREMNPESLKREMNPAKPELQNTSLSRAVAEYSGGTELSRLIMEPSMHALLLETYPDPEARADYIRRLTQYRPASEPSSAPLEHAGIYVLQLEGLSYQVYVGSSRDIPARVQQHRDGEGAVCTKDATRIEVLSTIPCTKLEDLDDMERRETLSQMYRLGIDKVRGWKFATRVLSDDYWKQAFEDICCRNRLCLRCGRSSHFITNCYARTRAEWCGGGEVPARSDS